MNIFYNESDLTFNQKIEILNYAKNNCIKWWVDKLDCSESLARQPIDMSYEEIMKKFTNKTFFSIMLKTDLHSGLQHGEIVFRTMSIIDYFLWIQMNTEILGNIVTKYNLKIR